MHLKFLVYLSALSLQVETLHAEEEEEEGKRTVARLSEKKINSGIKSLISKKFLRLQEGRIGKNPTTTPNPSRNKPSPPKKNPKQKRMHNLISDMPSSTSLYFTVKKTSGFWLSFIHFNTQQRKAEILLFQYFSCCYVSIL